jgi:hypothetical protein
LLILPIKEIVKTITLQLASNGATMDHGNRPKQKSALRLVEPELTLLRRGDGPDPRMVELVRLLARRAAREVYEEQMKERRPPRS